MNESNSNILPLDVNLTEFVWLIRDVPKKYLNYKEKNILIMLYSRGNEIRPTLDTLSDNTGISNGALADSLKVLEEDKKWLFRNRTPGRVTHYEIQIPPGVRLVSTTSASGGVRRILEFPGLADSTPDTGVPPSTLRSTTPTDTGEGSPDTGDVPLRIPETKSELEEETASDNSQETTVRASTADNSSSPSSASGFAANQDRLSSVTAKSTRIKSSGFAADLEDIPSSASGSNRASVPMESETVKGTPDTGVPTVSDTVTNTVSDKPTEQDKKRLLNMLNVAPKEAGKVKFYKSPETGKYRLAMSTRRNGGEIEQWYPEEIARVLIRSNRAYI